MPPAATAPRRFLLPAGDGIRDKLVTGVQTCALPIFPSYTFNTVNHPISPTAGKSLYISTEFAGSYLGGNVNLIRPAVDAKYFKQNPLHKSHILRSEERRVGKECRAGALA